MTEPPIRLAPARSWTPGLLVALAGSGLVAISVGLAWAIQPALQDFGFYAVNVSLPRLLSRGASGTVPNLGFVVLTLALLAAVVGQIGRGRGTDLLRRGLGVIVLALVTLFAIRYRQAVEGLPEQFAGFPGALRAGFYLALVGGLLMVLGGRSLRAPTTEAPATD